MKLKFLNFYGDGVSDEILIIINIDIFKLCFTNNIKYLLTILSCKPVDKKGNI